MVQDLTQSEIESLTQGILTRYGIDFTCYEPKSLKRRIIRVINRLELGSIHELWVKFLKDPTFVHTFMDEISVGMTSMFRDPVLWKNLKRRISQESDSKREMGVWHAGCSTGEEVYSFGILLSELNLREKTVSLATDFNQSALAEAKCGIYHKVKMIENESNYKIYNSTQNFGQYYNPDTKHVKMNESLIKNTSFKYHNLITDMYPNGFDIIFCRNVMIYFDSIAKIKILERFHHSLNPGGYLIIGFFDTMSHLIDNKKFALVDEEAKIFQKY